ncbi:hypothetical protein [Mycobacterium deserti]|uniref:Uncharacterized protein n=1 Tax=Mycobacterium deserti TaxID=2978347 RepID=A0ABT2MH50_9MYCO|nr:hypothetical protein [Mycobacterium deserti]MCT7660700.1 hypothetical protein [Mycobacterium deserti]
MGWFDERNGFKAIAPDKGVDRVAAASFATALGLPGRPPTRNLRPVDAYDIENARRICAAQ